MTIPGAGAIQSEGAAVEYLNGWIASRQHERPVISVLDAGCGERCALEYGPDAVVTGLDVSADLLARNAVLAYSVVGDLASAALDPASYDIIVCWDVLEHVNDPVGALDNLDHALASRGTLILKAPNLRSLKGVATKYTPYGFHRWVYRRFSVSTTAPFPTPFDGSVAPRALLSWATTRGLRLHWAAYWESELQSRLRTRLHLNGTAWNIAARALGTLSRGSLDATATDFVLMFERPAP